MNDLLLRLLTLLLIGSCICLASCSSKERDLEEPLVTLSSGHRKPAPVESEPQEERVELKAVYFDYNKAVLKPAAKKALRQNAAWLKKNADAHLQIEGRCDERGTEPYNLRLGEQRANAARDFLISIGVDPSRVSALSYGEVPGMADAVRAKNRNASPVLVYTK